MKKKESNYKNNRKNIFLAKYLLIIRYIIIFAEWSAIWLKMVTIVKEDLYIKISKDKIRR